MTKTEYQNFETAFASFMEREGIEILSSDDEEPGFSWRPCDCCERPEGGDRYNAVGAQAGVGIVAEGFSICGDCLYYSVYGRLDDYTMLEVQS